MNHPICIGITGASGAVYAVQLVKVILAAGRDVCISISNSGCEVLRHELGFEIDLEHFESTSLLPAEANEPLLCGKLYYYHWRDFTAPIASGSFLTGGMVVCPCSGTTLSAVATGASGNLIQRAAEVHLKERRRLVLVPREAPLSLAHIDNMRRVTEAGAVVLPASPGWYHGVDSVQDLVNFVVGRICDQLGMQNTLIQRWGGGDGRTVGR